MKSVFRVLACLFMTVLACSGWAAVQAHAPSPTLSPAQARAIAKEAYVYGFALVDNYRILHSYFVDRGHPEYKAPWNTISNVARVYTPDDKTIQSPNSDTPYSFLGVDLRAEPLVLSMPAIEKGRFYHAQFIDLYTHNFDYVGSRTTGNGEGRFLLAGPHWKGAIPKGIRKVIRSETELAFVLYRTQLFNQADIDQVTKIQAGFQVQTLSRFLGKPAPAAVPAIDFMQPLSASQERTSLQFFDQLNFILQFCPPHPSEKALMARFAQLGIGAGKKFEGQALPPAIRQAVEEGMADAWQANAETMKKVAAGQVTSGDILGTRKYLKNNYQYRMAAAAAGIYGNSKEEAMYPVYYNDATGQKLDAARHRYVLRFAPDQLPPVHAFWSLTLYELPSQLLVANPLNRYLINSAMLPSLRRDPDGGITIYLQHESPGKDLESNWLPAPNGPFKTALRLYWPRPEALNGSWKAPALKPAD